jgi:hypothetical protein
MRKTLEFLFARRPIRKRDKGNEAIMPNKELEPLFQERFFPGKYTKCFKLETKNFKYFF